MPIPTNLRRYIHTTPTPQGGRGSINTYIHTYIHKYIHTNIHTCLYLPTYVGTYILHPTHPTGGGGEAEIPCMIVGFQGDSTPNPRNHHHCGGGGGVAGLYHIYTSSTAQGGGGSFKNRKPIGELGCCESGMAERSH